MRPPSDRPQTAPSWPSNSRANRRSERRSGRCYNRGDARLPDPRLGRGCDDGEPLAISRPEPACAADAAAAARERGRLGRAARHRDVGRASAANGRDLASERRLTLRRTLGADVPASRRPPGYMLRVEPDQFDLGRFERLTRGGARGGSRSAVAAPARGALGLWRGAPSPTRSSRRSRRTRRGGSRSCGSSRPRTGSTPSSSSSGTARSSPTRVARAVEPAARAPARATHARALPDGPTGRGARALPRVPPRARRRAGDRARAAPAAAVRADPPPGARAREPTGGGRRRDGRLRGDLGGSRRRAARSGARDRRHARRRIRRFTGARAARDVPGPDLRLPARITPATSRRSRSTSS